MDKAQKKELLAAYKERRVRGGVYRLINRETGRFLLQWGADLTGCENRFRFALSTGSCIHPKLADDWKKLGGGAFSFEVLEELEKKETRTEGEFSGDCKALYELWQEKLASKEQY